MGTLYSWSSTSFALPRVLAEDDLNTEPNDPNWWCKSEDSNGFILVTCSPAVVVVLAVPGAILALILWIHFTAWWPRHGLSLWARFLRIFKERLPGEFEVSEIMEGELIIGTLPRYMDHLLEITEKGEGKRNFGVKGVLTLVEKWELGLSKESIEHDCHIPNRHLPTPDYAPVSLANLLEAIGFMKAVVKEGGPVFVHCASGKGRSAMCCIAYVMVTRNLDAEAALEFIKPKHNVANLTAFCGTRPQWRRMRELEEWLTQNTNYNPPAKGSGNPKVAPESSGPPTGELHLTIVRCNELKSKDLFSPSDSYCSIKFAPQNWDEKTIVIRNQNSPEFDKLFKIPMHGPEQANQVDLKVVDYDKGGKKFDDFIGHVKLWPDMSHKSATEGDWIPLKSVSVNEKDTGQILVKRHWVPYTGQTQQHYDTHFQVPGLPAPEAPVNEELPSQYSNQPMYSSPQPNMSASMPPPTTHQHMSPQPNYPQLPIAPPSRDPNMYSNAYPAMPAPPQDFNGLQLQGLTPPQDPNMLQQPYYQPMAGQPQLVPMGGLPPIGQPSPVPYNTQTPQ